MSIRDTLLNKDSAERAQIKSIAFSQLSAPAKFTKSGITVEIIGSISEIRGGVEVFARAWRGADPLGFANGVDVERFRIFKGFLFMVYK